MRNDVKHIQNILKYYMQLKRDIELFSQVSSPTINSTTGHSHSNVTETAVINHTDMAYQIKKVEDAIKVLDDKEQFVLIEYVMYKRYCRDDMCHQLGISYSGFNYSKNKILKKFISQYKTA